MNQSKLESKINAFAAIAQAESKIITQLYLLGLGFDVDHGAIRLPSKELEWSSAVLVCEVVKEVYLDHGLAAAKTLAKWLESLGLSSVIDSANRAIAFKQREIEYRQNFIDKFDRDEMAEAYADETTPTGNVHYRIVMSYDKNKRIYTGHRQRVTDINAQFWAENTLWFDYYGPEEDEQGLIRFVDYS